MDEFCESIPLKVSYTPGEGTLDPMGGQQAALWRERCVERAGGCAAESTHNSGEAPTMRGGVRRERERHQEVEASCPSCHRCSGWL